MKSIAIRRKFTYVREKPYSDCDLRQTNIDSFDSELYRLTFILNNRSYSQTDCYDLCYQRFVIETCNCSSLEYLMFAGTRACLTLEDARCLWRAEQQFARGDIGEQCNPSCPLECSWLSFDLKTSSSFYPSNMYTKMLNKHHKIIARTNSTNNTNDFLHKNVLRLNLYYDRLNYLVISESPSLLFFDLLATVGGTLGMNFCQSIKSLID